GASSRRATASSSSARGCRSCSEEAPSSPASRRARRSRPRRSSPPSSRPPTPSPSGGLVDALARPHHRLQEVAVELADEVGADLLRTGGLALEVIGAAAEALGVHCGDHVADAV